MTSQSDMIPSWPEETEKEYKRMEQLGRGAFGTVWMAKSKRNNNNNNNNRDDYVAIKISNSLDDPIRKEFAKREQTILKELNHPHILKFIQSSTTLDKDSIQNNVLITSLANGPNLESLRQWKGALGLPLCRLISRQLISAVSYLHGRAVIHRDIKPANIILSRIINNNDCTMTPYTSVEEYASDNLIFDDGIEGERGVEDGRWKIVLVDFGLARALTPEEVFGKQLSSDHRIRQRRTRRNSSKYRWSITNENIRELSKERMNETIDSIEQSNSSRSEHTVATDDASSDVGEKVAVPSNNIKDVSRMEKIIHDENLVIGSDSPPSPPQDNINNNNKKSPSSVLRRNRRISFTRNKLAMSALGTRGYIAPEISRRARNKVDHDRQLSHEPLTETVADYGMISDAYSVGITIRELLTGVPADCNIAEYIAFKKRLPKSSFLLLSTLLCRGGGSTKGKKKKKKNKQQQQQQQQQQQRRFRYLSEIPEDAANLVRCFTRPDIIQRISVREAQSHPWIEGTDETDKYVMPQGDVPSGYGHPVVFLECAKHRSKKGGQKKN